MTQPNLNNLKDPIQFLALGYGSGLFKPAPGTWGTLASVPLWWLLAQTTLPVYVLICVISFVIGIYLCGKTAERLGVHDHSAIVWDEFVGLWVTMIAVPVTWPNLLLGFVLFRIFDIVKPWPIRELDRKVHGGFGIMIDDIVAGIMACLSLHALVWLFSYL